MYITSKRIVNKYNAILFNIESKREIGIDKLLGITKSISETTGEFVLHIKQEYDYRMKSDTRD